MALLTGQRPLSSGADQLWNNRHDQVSTPVASLKCPRWASGSCKAVGGRLTLIQGCVSVVRSKLWKTRRAKVPRTANESGWVSGPKDSGERVRARRWPLGEFMATGYGGLAIMSPRGRAERPEGDGPRSGPGWQGPSLR